MEIKVGIVEDDKLINESLAKLINDSEGFSCKDTFNKAEEAIKRIPLLNLDVVLMDIHLPGKSGIECINELKPNCANTQFVMCTSFEDTDSVFKSLKSGATGYIIKSTQPSKILEAIIDVYRGGSPMTSHIARKIITSFQEVDKNLELEKLSQREQEIILLLSKGLRYKEISAKLYLSIETVRTHIRNIYEKLQVNSRTEALNKTFRK